MGLITAVGRGTKIMNKEEPGMRYIFHLCHMMFSSDIVLFICCHLCLVLYMGILLLGPFLMHVKSQLQHCIPSDCLKQGEEWHFHPENLFEASEVCLYHSRVKPKLQGLPWKNEKRRAAPCSGYAPGLWLDIGCAEISYFGTKMSKVLSFLPMQNGKYFEISEVLQDGKIVF